MHHPLGLIREGSYGNGGRLTLNFRDNGEFLGCQIERGKGGLVEVDRRQINEPLQDHDSDFFTAFFPTLDEANKTDPFATRGGERLQVDRRAGAVIAKCLGTQPLLEFEAIEIAARNC